MEGLGQVARLRRAERAVPQNRDVAAVRAELEAELGETVSQRLAAELLGVSHTAIRRWIGRGDVPVVYAPRGSRQLPVAAVLDLYEMVERERRFGPASARARTVHAGGPRAGAPDRRRADGARH